MFISSSQTREAKKLLEQIQSDELDGKKLLKDFLDNERKILSNKKSASEIISESQKPDSSVYKFATL